MTEPAVVFRTHSDVEAWVVRGLLDAHGLQTFVRSGATRALFPVSVGHLAEVQVAVPADQAEEARELIAAHRGASGPGGRVLPFPGEASPIEGAMGYRFRAPALLAQALTHRSRAQEEGEAGLGDNESLEFLGDAILGFVVAEWLHAEFPAADEGWKSKVKASLVSRSSLARIAARLGVGEALRLGRGEEKTGGRHKQALLADACEALIAAVHLDGGIDAARAFVLRELQPVIDLARRPGLLTALTGDYKSALQEVLQARQAPPPEYRLVQETGPDHDKRFEVEVVVDGRPLARAGGHAKKQAEQTAARLALRELGEDPA
jgi:ribonuclease-3